MSDFPTVSPFHPLPHQSPPRMAVVSYSLPACRSALTREAGLYPIRIDAKLGRWVKNLAIRSWSFWSPTDFASIYWRSPPQTNITRRTRCFFFHPSPPWFVKKKTWASNYQETFLAALPVTPTSAHTKMAVHRSSNQPPSITQLQGHPDGRCCCQPKRPHTRSALGPWLFGTPQKEEEEMTQKKKAGKIYVHAWYSRGSLGICQWNAQFIIKFVGYPTYSRNGPLIFSRAPQLKPLAQVKGHTFHLAQRGFEDRLGKVMGFPQERFHNSYKHR